MRLIALVALVLMSLVLDLVTGAPFNTLIVGAVITANLGHIDLTTETPITLAEAARTLPGGAVHVSTIHRWRMKGCRGVRLITFLRGGVRHTTRQAIERFFDAVTAAADGETPPTQTSTQRERAIKKAEAECERSGI
jgi:hypothetical protein